MPRPFRCSKPIIWLTIAIIGLLLILSGSNAVTMKKFHTGFTQLSDEDLIAMETLRAVSKNASETHRCLLNMSITQREEEAEAHLTKLRLAREINNRNLEKLKVLVSLPDQKAATAEMSAAREDYLKLVDQFLAQRQTLPEAQLDDFRIKQVRPAFDRYLMAQDLLSDQIFNSMKATMAAMQKNASTWHRLNLGMSLGPLLPILALVLAALALLMWLGWMLPRDED
jgi:phage gp36-like protein